MNIAGLDSIEISRHWHQSVVAGGDRNGRLIEPLNNCAVVIDELLAHL